MSATPEHGGLYAALRAEAVRRGWSSDAWWDRADTAWIRDFLTARAAAPDALRERVEALAAEWDHNYHFAAARLRALLDDPAAAGRATSGGHWLCSCGDWHAPSRSPDEEHRQVMAVGSEGWF